MIAYNYRMDAIQGAILRVKLRRAEQWTEQRRRIAALYRERLGNLPLRRTDEAAGRRHVYHIFSVFHPERDRLQAFLAERGIQTGKHYPIPLHLQQCYAHLGHRKGDFPASERVGDEQLSLPLYPEMPDADVELVTQAIGDWLGSA